jgi:adenylate cyclase
MKAALSLLLGAVLSRRAFGLCLLAALVALRISDPAPLEELKLRTFDLFQTIKPRADVDRPVVIVDIDEVSLSAYGQWPWPRTLVAQLLDRLAEWQSTAVAFDVLFPEPDRASPNEAMKYFYDLDEATRARLQQLPNNDDILAKAIGRGKVVLGQAGTRTNSAPASSEQLPATGVAVLGPDPAAYLFSFPTLLRNLPQLERAAAGRGLFTIATERDGMVRRVPLIMIADGNLVPALSIDLLRVATGAGAVLVRSDQAGVREISVAKVQLPTDQNGRVWVHFSPHEAARYVSAKDVIEGMVSPERFSGRLVLVGTSATGLLDIKTTPVHAAMPGVEIHAQILEAALTGALLNAPSYAMVLEIAIAVAIGLILILLAPLVGAGVLFVVAALGITVIAAGSWILYGNYQLLLDPSFPLISTLAVYVSLTLIGYFREQADRRRIRSAFSQYLSPSLVEQLANSPQKLVLGGEERDMTVLFSDVRGFTAIAETFRHDPKGLTSLMNRFLTPLTNSILARNGTIDKYMGDAIMAFWNAPLDDPLHAVDACDSALQMLEQVDALNRERAAEAAETKTQFIPIRMGIGINTGLCLVGNMGSDLRFQYTVMGDSVNLASRLEGQTAAHGVPLLIGSKTAEAVSDRFAVLQVDAILVKGKSDPEVIYTIIGRSDVGETAEFRSLQDLWTGLLNCYRGQDWSGANELIERCRSLGGKFGLNDLVKLYEERISHYQVNPPPPDWDGIFVAQTK